MASITNRSRFFVEVKGNTDYDRTFPFHRLADAKAYHASLVAKKLKPVLGQLEDTIEVRIRQKGYPDQNYTARSVAEAGEMEDTIRLERRRGLFIDYTKAHHVTFVELIERYTAEEGPKHKGWEKVEKYKCQGWLEDVKGGLARRITQRAAELAATGRASTARGAMRQPATGLEWMEKPFAQVQTTDIEGYIRDRLDVVAPATVDREVDVLSSICHVATNVWKYRVDENPMTGVRRPRYFNERDRRLKPGEEARLLATAREEDRLRSLDLRVEALMMGARDTVSQYGTVYQKKKHIKASLAACRAQAEADHEHIPLYEAFITFQLMTAARRGEALNLTWDHVDLDAQSAFLPETKNGRPRALPLRADLMAILATLPREDARVFPLGTDMVDDAWARITARAGLIDLHLHDLRHEGISCVAETGQFSLVDLQKFSGHRDTRMLLRYAHLCTKQLANRLDAAFGVKAKSSDLTAVHRGRRRLRAGSGLTLAAIVGDFDDQVAQVSVEKRQDTAAPTQTNVIAFRRG